MRSKNFLAIVVTASLSFALGCRQRSDDTSTEKTLEHFQGITPTANGFRVMCSNRTEVIELSQAEFQRQVSNNTICDGNIEDALYCKPRTATTAYVTRVQDDKSLGVDLPIEGCRQLIQGSRRGLFCQPRSTSSSHVSDIKTGQTFGTDVENEQCVSLVTATSNGLICLPRTSDTSFVSTITGTKVQNFGTDIDHASCATVTSGAMPPFFCRPRTDVDYRVAKVSNGEDQGSDVSLEMCLRAIGSNAKAPFSSQYSLTMDCNSPSAGKQGLTLTATDIATNQVLRGQYVFDNVYNCSTVAGKYSQATVHHLPKKIAFCTGQFLVTVAIKPKPGNILKIENSFTGIRSNQAACLREMEDLNKSYFGF